MCLFSKGKNLVLPLAFCALCAAAALAVLLPPVQAMSAGAGVGGFVPVTELQPVPQKDVVTLEGLPQPGAELGRLTIDGTAVDCVLYYGDGDEQLKQGAGLYTGLSLPGQSGCVLVGGHTNTYFRDLEKAEVGGEVVLSLYYGEYRYEITEWKIARADDPEAYDPDPPQEQLVLYTCYPFGALYDTPLRYFIYGRMVSGPALQLP